MNLADLYRDWRIMGGMALPMLGIGNWALGLSQHPQIYGQKSQSDGRAARRTLPQLRRTRRSDHDQAVLAPFIAEQREVSFARARMDFYHATFHDRALLGFLGLVLSSWVSSALFELIPAAPSAPESAS